MDFNVSSKAIGKSSVVLISVEGELDIASAEELVEPTEVAVSTARPLVFDLSECPFIDSSGLRVVLQAHHALSDVGARLALVTDQVQAKRLMSLTGTDLRIPVFKSVDEALAWFETDEAEAPNAAGPSASAPTNGRPPTTSRLP